MDPVEADALEDLYFTNRVVLLELRAVERELIREYLASRLKSPELEQFEARYLKIPELMARVESVRRSPENVVVMPTRDRHPWKSIGIAALVVTAVGGTYWIGSRPRPTRTTSLPTSGPRVAVNPAASILLTPGALAGEQVAARLVLPSGGGPIRFRLLLPVEAAGAACSVRISEANKDGDIVTVWESPSDLPPVLVGDKWEVHADLPPAVAKRGDYAIQLGWPGHRPGVTYVVRLLAPAAN